MRPRQPFITWKSSGRSDPLRVLGINPWIYDFAAFNVWSRPAGLLCCLDMFSRSGADTALADFMDRMVPGPHWPRAAATGRGHYPKTFLPKPWVLKNIPRQYSRYGLARDMSAQALSGLDPAPDLILVTSLMTYWYPGVGSAIKMARQIFPEAKICLGGIYATLCREHAEAMGADLVVSGPLERPDNWARVWSLAGRAAPALPDQAGLALDTSYYRDPEFSLIMGSRGCPFNCPYCASSRLYNGFRQADPARVIKGIRQDYERGVRDFAFYDDALLVNPEKMLYPVLDFIIESKYNLRLHAPNALHIRYLTPQICRLLKRAGLVTVRLGLETADFRQRQDHKLDFRQWRKGVANLLEAGFSRQDLVVYVMAGLPGQQDREIIKTVREVLSLGIRPELNHYSPIPGTPMFERAVEESTFPLDDPLCHNNSIWPCVAGGFSWEGKKRWQEAVQQVLQLKMTLLE
ncbi:B12-binding domain-containing radical SAM protein [Desulfonatronovibrio hydrogenovorans]|uniref:B12-binding domain-containing radical SAM protein n=1 Tax=Desulfonatronovibrio hydrogenovorans TaxID=53245 RepID=UPI0005537AA1|nr:radical SAM protein [Desulfonatronovibrio hydrogenovorans]